MKPRHFVCTWMLLSSFMLTQATAEPVDEARQAAEQVVASEEGTRLGRGDSDVTAAEEDTAANSGLSDALDAALNTPLGDSEAEESNEE